ncbi:hypothetical protein ACIBCM_06690 [Streptomyces sp. NPDC051018]|uniref:hypothetical protein n=1 Tax=Streptomyces sp. NPDC051018 TaxID=3365639 RepID=UPI0037BAE079
MLLLLPERNLSLVLEQNLHGLLQDEAVMQVGFGAARILAGAPAPADSPSTRLYDVTVWGTTALAVLMLAAAVRSALLLRRTPVPVSAVRRIAGTAVWVLAGALPGTLIAMAVKFTGTGQLLTWVPDSFIALCVAAGAGALVIVLRIVRAIRRPRPAAERPTPLDRGTQARTPA